jgi:hypothetical protein
VTPPGGGAGEPDQARGLGRDAVRRHELLLLADRIQESERVRSEADQRQRTQRQQAQAGARKDRQTIAPRGAENQEGQQQPRSELDAHSRDERAGGRPEAWAGSCGERQREGQDEDDQRVVVGAADGQHEQHRVQPDKGRRPAPG